MIPEQAAQLNVLCIGHDRRNWHCQSALGAAGHSLWPRGSADRSECRSSAALADGVEAQLAPGLPLGLDSDAIYEERRFVLQPGGQLALISDGVAEAANGGRELFGFERAAAISKEPAAHIAQEARAWGQNDDITVVNVRRTAA